MPITNSLTEQISTLAYRNFVDTCRSTATRIIYINILSKICENGIDDDGDGLIDTEDLDCDEPPPPGVEHRFTLSNCVRLAGTLFCDAEQTRLSGNTRLSSYRFSLGY